MSMGGKILFASPPVQQTCARAVAQTTATPKSEKVKHQHAHRALTRQLFVWCLDWADHPSYHQSASWPLFILDILGRARDSNTHHRVVRSFLPAHKTGHLLGSFVLVVYTREQANKRTHARTHAHMRANKNKKSVISTVSLFDLHERASGPSVCCFISITQSSYCVSRARERANSVTNGGAQRIQQHQLITPHEFLISATSRAELVFAHLMSLTCDNDNRHQPYEAIRRARAPSPVRWTECQPGCPPGR